jgi:hypothetical protein
MSSLLVATASEGELLQLTHARSKKAGCTTVKPARFTGKGLRSTAVLPQ